MARKTGRPTTVHRGAGRGLTPQEAHRAGAQRAAATKARLKALVDSGVKPEIVKAGWNVVKGRKLDTREAFFAMHETSSKEVARYHQDQLFEALKVAPPVGQDWADLEWEWAWY